MKRIKTNEEFINHVNDEFIVEMARININDGFPYCVYVKGGDHYGQGRKEHGDPHFHFYDKAKGGNWEFSVLIPTVEEWKQNKNIYISETFNGDYNWTGFKSIKKDLIEWLDKKNKISKTHTNIEFIRLQWNVLNIDNKNVKQLSRIKEDE
jgi:hypothetical protein